VAKNRHAEKASRKKGATLSNAAEKILAFVLQTPAEARIEPEAEAPL